MHDPLTEIVKTLKNQPMETNTQILNELKNLSGRMLQMESRMDSISSTTSSPAKSLSRSKTGDEAPVRTPEARTQPCTILQVAWKTT